MPDLQTALTLALQDWTAGDKEPDVQKPPAPAEKNTSRELFDLIQKNPGLSKQQIAHRMHDRGHKKTSVYALMRMMERQHVAEFKNGGVYCISAQYVSLKSASAMNRYEARHGITRPLAPEQKKRSVAGKKNAAKRLGPEQLLLAPVEQPNGLLERISVFEAYDLYKKLHSMFGGNHG